MLGLTVRLPRDAGATPAADAPAALPDRHALPAPGLARLGLCPPAAGRDLRPRSAAQRDRLGLPRPVAHPQRLQPQARHAAGLHQERRLHLQRARRARALRSRATVRTFRSSSKAGFGKLPDLERGKVPEDWWYFPVVARLHRERTGYPTQKPEALLERDDRRLLAARRTWWGTSSAVRARRWPAPNGMGREWIGCDAHPLALHVAHRRLLLQDGCRPFRLESTAPEPRSLRGWVRTSVERQGSELAVRLDGLQGRSSQNALPRRGRAVGGRLGLRRAVSSAAARRPLAPGVDPEIPSRLPHTRSLGRLGHIGVRVVPGTGDRSAC